MVLFLPRCGVTCDGFYGIDRWCGGPVCSYSIIVGLTCMNVGEFGPIAVFLLTCELHILCAMRCLLGAAVSVVTFRCLLHLCDFRRYTLGFGNVARVIFAFGVMYPMAGPMVLDRGKCDVYVCSSGRNAMLLVMMTGRLSVTADHAWMAA